MPRRYYAIVRPLKYPMTITKRVVIFMILATWISPAVLSFIPIFAGWYTTDSHKEELLLNPDNCNFEVNRVYAVVSSSISFWIPCTIMLFTYYAIFKEANRQEKQLALRQGTAMLMHRHSSGAAASTSAARSSGGGAAAPRAADANQTGDTNIDGGPTNGKSYARKMCRFVRVFFPVRHVDLWVGWAFNALLLRALNSTVPNANTIDAPSSGPCSTEAERNRL